jgi:cyclophilin family peptidyl-prolyl cis-trans isomerase
MNGHLIAAACVISALAAGCQRAAESGKPAAGTQDASLDATLPIGKALRVADAAVVELRTSMGTIKVKLHAEKAPLTVDNFLAKVDRGFYDQTIFHQVEPGYVVVAGGFRADLAEKSSRYSIPNEARNGLSNRRGTVAMARSGDVTDSSTGQFFINVGDNPDLDYKGETVDLCGYCVFGEVVEGIDVVDGIAQLQTQSVRDFSHLPVKTVLIESAARQR